MTNTPATMVDAHVHFHSCFAPAAFLSAAAANFRRAARSRGLQAEMPGVLCFTENAADQAFRRFRDGELKAAGWEVEATAEPESLRMRNGGTALLLVAGRQIVTREGLEVLALGTDAEFPDGLALADAVARAVGSDAVAVVPWGFGKWWFGRGRLLAEFLQSPAARGVLLGDNGGRLAIGPRPRLLAAAAQRGRVVLPGSDPLPFPAQVRRAGSYGFVLPARLPDDRPAAALREFVLSTREQPCPFGRMETPLGFLISQVAMQWRKRRPPRPSAA